MSNIIFRLSTKLKGFETFEETQKFFLNILPNRDNSYFFNTKRFNKIKPNEIIYFLYGKEIIAKAKFLGEIKTDIARDKDFIQGHKIEILKILDQGFSIDANKLNQKTTRSIGYIEDEDTKYLEKIINKTYMENKNMNIKNIMLYGAPGVGKTFNCKKLVALIEGGDFTESKIFDFVINNKNDEIEDGSIDELYETIKNEKRIEFVTFHQNYSYEDFIEGFRPNENGDIELDKKGGIFKRIADKAKENLENSQINEDAKQLNFDELIQKFTNHVQDSLDKEEKFFIDKKITIESINDRGAFVLGGSIKSNTQRLTPDIIKRDYLEFKNGNIKSYEDVKPTYESQKSTHGNARYYFMIYKKIAEFEKTLNVNTIQKRKEARKNYYIVIDEINRGNISKIFGELITLIEEDKRGKKEYEVTLPYSKTPFLIPENLYIIATMNSTDKSIATIDIALRRRFTFLKMKPNSSLVTHSESKALMDELNQLIKETLGEDYMLGHSYFMQNMDLDFVKSYKIKPLLEEYFYGDTENYQKAINILEME